MAKSEIGIDRIRHRNGLVLTLDLGISTFSSILAILFVRWQVHAVFEFERYFLVWVIFAFLASLLSFLIFGNHKIVIRHATFRSMGRLTYSVLLKEVILAVFMVLNILGILDMPAPMLLLFVDLAITMLLMISVRLIIMDIMNSTSNTMAMDVDRLAVMVYGTSDKSVAMVTRLDQSRKYNVCGFVTLDRSRAGQVIADHKVYWVENEDDLEKMKVNHGIESILFASEADAEAQQDGLVGMCLRKGVHILLTPKIESINYNGMSLRSIKRMVDSDFIPDGMSSFERNFKRGVDMVLAALLLVVFSPLFLICFIAIKIGDGGPAIYSQERIGRFGRPFKIYKFRSMKIDAEKDGPALLAGEEDPRLTKVGGFLRRHHLDELPQLWNVFRGDMAFIGPRPERKYYIDQIMEKDPRYYYLYQIRPGVTSYATLRNGYTDSMEKMLRRLEFDLYYLRHRSWWFDIWILWKTFCNIAFGKKF